MYTCYRDCGPQGEPVPNEEPPSVPQSATYGLSAPIQIGNTDLWMTGHDLLVASQDGRKVFITQPMSSTSHFPGHHPSDSRIIMFDRETGEQTFVSKPNSPRARGLWVSPDGTKLATLIAYQYPASQDNYFMLYDLENTGAGWVRGKDAPTTFSIEQGPAFPGTNRYSCHAPAITSFCNGGGGWWDAEVQLLPGEQDASNFYGVFRSPITYRGERVGYRDAYSENDPTIQPNGGVPGYWAGLTFSVSKVDSSMGNSPPKYRIYERTIVEQ
jgi:WD40 repeat protein